MLNKRKDTRPVNLQLWTIRFPITAIVSILHRVSGFGLFLIIPVILCNLQYSLVSYENFTEVQNYFTNIYFKIFLWLLLSGLSYHAIAGIRHLLMDIHIGDSKKSGRIGAVTVLITSVLASLLFGVYLW